MLDEWVNEMYVWDSRVCTKNVITIIRRHKWWHACEPILCRPLLLWWPYRCQLQFGLCEETQWEQPAQLHWAIPSPCTRDRQQHWPCKWGWGSKSSSKCVAKPSKGLQHAHQASAPWDTQVHLEVVATGVVGSCLHFGAVAEETYKSENMNKKIKYEREKHTSVSESETSIGASTDFWMAVIGGAGVGSALGARDASPPSDWSWDADGWKTLAPVGVEGMRSATLWKSGHPLFQNGFASGCFLM